VRGSVKVGKGTVSAGKAIIAPMRTKAPPMKEPKVMSAGRATRRQKERGLHAAVSRSMKRMERSEIRQTSDFSSPTFLAGELSALEQSCRTVSKMLARMSGVAQSSPLSSSFSNLLSNQFEKETNHDKWFLHGDATQLGVVPTKDESNRGGLIAGFVVARCLWESHWREEWCGVYENCISVYAPLSKSPCLEIQIRDVRSVRRVDPELSPLAGLPILAIETAWLCYYMAFSDVETMSHCESTLETLLAPSKQQSADTPTKARQEAELRKAHFWQNLQASTESGLSSGRGKWAEVSSGSKSKRRIVLNGRRLEFDLEQHTVPEVYFVQSLLQQALSFSLDSISNDPEGLIKFLDATSQLRTFSLRELDLSSASALCMFVNLYHCLLQHALLFTVNGPLQKRSCGHFMRTSCYEIGGDVFSLAELHSCIIRGKLSRPIAAPKAPFFEASRKSNAYRFYALSYTSPVVNFVLNTGHASFPRHVKVLHTETLDEQLNEIAQEYLSRNMVVDASKRSISLPKIMDVYRNDFVSDQSVSPSAACLQYCMDFVKEATALQIRSMQLEDSVVTIKYLSPVDSYHSTLKGYSPPKQTLQSV
jgi:Protein of unknown function, DUF547